MAEKIIKYYKYIEDMQGATGKIKLAQITKVPSTKAAFEPDVPAILQKFKDAIQEMTGKPAPEF